MQERFDTLIRSMRDSISRANTASGGIGEKRYPGVEAKLTRIGKVAESIRFYNHLNSRTFTYPINGAEEFELTGKCFVLIDNLLYPLLYFLYYFPKSLCL
ncbi:hypothetical protein EZS27_042231 [termite gut metagenome]|uniref:Uncharacterized protein n=1 Tax=termite gut metagenome TaxID=433724 RepID=A0A5J4PC84_9ZZZZ